MKISFIGAAHEVTGSCTYIEVGDKKGLVDYGMEQGKDLFENVPIPVAAGELDFVLLTHAHIDHSGRLPLLYKEGFRGSVYATAATCSLCDIMLRDSANIQISEAEWKSRKAQRNGGAAVEPLYDLDDVAGLMGHMIPCRYNTIVQVNDCVSVRFTDVGHLLGSAAIEVWLTEGNETRKICFSGDIGNLNQPILRDPQHVRDAEYLVIESTYGDRLHSTERVDYVAELAKRIQQTLDKGGNLVIPSFAVGRTQEMLYFIREIKERGLVTGHGDFQVYVDSPLAIEATSIFLQCDSQFVDDDMQRLIRAGINPIVFPGLELAVSQEESKNINENKTPKVILSASGMCDAGRIRHHLKHNLWRSECCILFVGYQSEGTLGRALVDGAKKVKLFNEEIQVNATIDVLPGVSGHADKAGLIQWLQGFDEKPEMVFVNHGDPDSADSFTDTLNHDLGYRAAAPYSGASYDLLSGVWDYVAQPKPIKAATGKLRTVSKSFERLLAAAERLLKICKRLEGRPNRTLEGFAKDIDKLSDKIERWEKG
jgi:metallo-beta-lactamase family protein